MPNSTDAVRLSAPEPALGVGVRLSRFAHRNARFLFPAPAAITVALIIIYPVLYTGWMSLQEWFASSLTLPKFIALANYQQILTGDPRFREAFFRTLYFTFLAVSVEVFVMMYHPTLGVMNYLVSLTGLAPFKWTYSSRTALYALALVDVWEWTPLIMLIALAGLAALPREPYESALIDGATGLQSFWYITLPLLRPTIIVAILFRAIDALKTFDIIFVMTQGGPSNSSETINILLFNQAFSYFNMGYASSMAVALFAIVMGASLILMKVRRVGW
ncbi:MAG: sugar ABC transporter permease [candidate division NC10 bacterium]|nr:sugar ABC transporter permease [candidate division NC10 bacterium]